MGNDVYKGLKAGVASIAAIAMLGLGIPTAYAEDSNPVSNSQASSQTSIGSDTVVTDQDGNGYATIAAAIKAGAVTVTMQSDLSENVSISGKSGLTIDGNGHKLSGSVTFAGNNDGVSVRNIDFVGTGVQIHVNGANNKNVDIRNNVFDVTANGTWAVIYIQKTVSGLNIEGNTFNVAASVTSTVQCIGFAYTADIRATDITIAGNTLNSAITKAYAYFVIGGGNVTNGEYAITNLTLEGNTVAPVSGGNAYGAWLRNVDTLTVKGNDFSGYAGIGLGAGTGIAPTRNVTLESNNFNVSKGGLVVSSPEALDGPATVKNNTGFSYTNTTLQAGVVHADGTIDYYKTLSEAFKAIADGETLKLLNDVTATLTIEANQNIGIDLNGHTLTNEAGKHTIVNKGTLTVTDSSAAKTGTVDNVSNSKAAVVNYSGATATLAGGNYTRSKEASTYDPDTDKASSGGNSYYVLKNFGTMTIKDPSVVKFADKNTGLSSSLVANGWYSASDNDGDATVNAYGANGGATLTIEGGTLIGGKITVKNDDWGILNITGGKITQPVENFYAVLTYHKASISGGEISAPMFPIGASGIKNAKGDVGETIISGDAKVISEKGYALRALDNGKLTVTGGTFTSGNKQGVSDLKPSTNGTPSVSISGGTFNVKPTEDELAEDYVVKENADGTFGAKLRVAATITKADGTVVEYTSLAKAVKAAAAGDTIAVQDAETLTANIEISKNVILDLNGKTVKTAGFKFAVTNGGKLTVTGNGTVINTVAADEDNDDLHAMFDVSKGGILFIENGIYTGDGAPVASVEGTMVVNGGGFSVIKAAIFVLPEESGAALTINGGTYQDATVAISATAGTNKLAITGGNFDVSPVSSDKDQAYTKYITGGTYAKNPGQSTIADDKKFMANDSGRYVIVDAKIASVETLKDITVAAGTDPSGQLPSKVKVELDNGLTRDGVDVIWGSMPDTWKGPRGGTIKLEGTVDGSDGVKAEQTIIVEHATIKSATVDVTELSTPAGVDPTGQLPKQATIVWSSGDSDTEMVDVKWDAIKLGDFAKPGSFEVNGTVSVDGYSASVKVKVNVGKAVAIKVEATETSVETIATNKPSDLDKVQAKVTWSDNTITTEDVTWPEINADQYASAGSFDVTGTVKGVQINGADATVTVTVNVVARVIAKVTPSDESIEVDTAGDADPKPAVTGKTTLTWNDGKTSTVDVPLTLPDGWNHPRAAHDVAVSGRVDGWKDAIPFTVRVKAAAAVGVTASGVSTEEKVAPVLPDFAVVTWSNGETSDEKIEWPSIDAGKYEAAGSFKVTGNVKGIKVDGKDATVTITVTVTAATITSVDAPADVVVTKSGVKPVLPATLTAHWSNGTESQVSVAWGELNKDAYTALAGGDYELKGSVAGWDGKVTVKIHVDPATPVKLANDGKVETTTKVGVAPELPSQLNVVWSNGDKLAAAVAWNEIDSALLAKVGTFTATGSVTVPADASGLAEGAAVSTTVTFPIIATVTVEAVPVTSVAISVDSTDLAIGGTAKAVATVKPGNATDQKVTWTSSDEKIITVDADGNVKAIAEGTAEITATAGGVSSKAVKITVTNVAVKAEATKTSVETIATNAPDLSKVQAKVTWSDGTTTTEKVEWKAVDADQYASAGNFKVTGTVKGITIDGKKATVTVTVNVAARAVTAVTASRESIEVATATDTDPKPAVTGKAMLTWNDGKTSEVDVPLALPDGWNHPRTAHDVAVSGRVDGWKDAVPFTVHVKAAKAIGAANPADVSTEEKVVPTLPETAVVTWSNGETSAETITWNQYDEGKLDKPGKFTVEGSAKGLSVSVTVTVVAATLTGVDAPADVVTTASGVKPVLPATLTAHWSNGTESQVGVKWAESDAYTALAGGDYELKGSVAGWDGKVTVKVHVDPATPVKLANDGKVETTTKVGVAPELPSRLNVVWSNGDKLAAAVAWNEINSALLAKAGTFTVSGVVTVPADASGLAEGSAQASTITFPIAATVTVKAGSSTNPNDGEDNGKDNNDNAGKKPSKTPLSDTGVAIGGIACLTVLLFAAGIVLSIKRQRR
ncbi:Ig-like domain-containing protein [Bifidobacterium cebidarum]|uniref:Bacterial Ig-like domain (Group 4) n=1 Tax=Bifidobacterium cebidarum TaxID=2650773 RepID=A0A6I1GH11_9BIFI|nr:Ig-like domain-containing protein [Bifidobacterium cebidarum]KAB7788659.1 Bacterial Ig-like domain (group 4) [Bifidobacterium cebidarum]